MTKKSSASVSSTVTDSAECSRSPTCTPTAFEVLT
jgi:hypothetical protein